MLTSRAAEADAPPAGRAAPARASGPLDDVIVLAHEVRGLLHDQLQLLACEARLAVLGLTRMVAGAVVIGVLLVTAWLGVMAAVALSLISFNIAPASSVLLLAALNLLLALVAFGLLRRRSQDLEFPATLRSLKPAPAGNSGRAAA